MRHTWDGRRRFSPTRFLHPHLAVRWTGPRWKVAILRSTHAGWRETGPGLAARVERRDGGSLGGPNGGILGTGVPVHALLCRPLTSPPAGNVFQGFVGGLAPVWRPAEGSVRQTDKLGSLWRDLLCLSRSWDWSCVSSSPSHVRSGHLDPHPRSTMGVGCHCGVARLC
jgi:hypothetical protein